MQPGGTCAYPTAQPRTNALLVLAIVAQATPCLPPPSMDGRGWRHVSAFPRKRRCIKLRVGCRWRWTITGVAGRSTTQSAVDNRTPTAVRCGQRPLGAHQLRHVDRVDLALRAFAGHLGDGKMSRCQRVTGVRLISRSRDGPRRGSAAKIGCCGVPWPLRGSNTIGKIICLRLIVVCDHLSGEPVKISLAAAVQLSVVRSRRRLVTSRARTTFPFASNNGCAAAR